MGKSYRYFSMRYRPQRVPYGRHDRHLAWRHDPHGHTPPPFRQGGRPLARAPIRAEMIMRLARSSAYSVALGRVLLSTRPRVLPPPGPPRGTLSSRGPSRPHVALASLCSRGSGLGPHAAPFPRPGPGAPHRARSSLRVPTGEGGVLNGDAVPSLSSGMQAGQQRPVCRCLSPQCPAEHSASERDWPAPSGGNNLAGARCPIGEDRSPGPRSPGAFIPGAPRTGHIPGCAFHSPIHTPGNFTA